MARPRKRQASGYENAPKKRPTAIQKALNIPPARTHPHSSLHEKNTTRTQKQEKSVPILMDETIHAPPPPTRRSRLIPSFPHRDTSGEGDGGSVQTENSRLWQRTAKVRDSSEESREENETTDSSFGNHALAVLSSSPCPSSRTSSSSLSGALEEKEGAEEMAGSMQPPRITSGDSFTNVARPQEWKPTESEAVEQEGIVQPIEGEEAREMVSPLSGLSTLPRSSSFSLLLALQQRAAALGEFDMVSIVEKLAKRVASHCSTTPHPTTSPPGEDPAEHSKASPVTSSNSSMTSLLPVVESEKGGRGERCGRPSLPASSAAHDGRRLTEEKHSLTLQSCSASPTLATRHEKEVTLPISLFSSSSPVVHSGPALCPYPSSIPHLPADVLLPGMLEDLRKNEEMEQKKKEPGKEECPARPVVQTKASSPSSPFTPVPPRTHGDAERTKAALHVLPTPHEDDDGDDDSPPLAVSARREGASASPSFSIHKARPCTLPASVPSSIIGTCHMRATDLHSRKKGGNDFSCTTEWRPSPRITTNTTSAAMNRHAGLWNRLTEHPHVDEQILVLQAFRFFRVCNFFDPAAQ